MNAFKMVQEVQDLIDRYGVDNIKSTVLFIDGLKEPTYTIWHNHVSGGEIRLTHSQYMLLRDTYARGNAKIAAIKLLREYTGIGLRDAKEMIEKYFQHM